MISGSLSSKSNKDPRKFSRRTLVYYLSFNQDPALKIIDLRLIFYFKVNSMCIVFRKGRK